MLFRFLTMMAACAALLLGIQIPAFADQYLKRLDAHLAEITQNLRPYQEIADHDFHGSILGLVGKHAQSADPVFQTEGQAIERMYVRYQHFKLERDELATPWWRQFWVIAQQHDKELLGETWNSYTPMALLNAPALYCGMGLVFLVLLLTELGRGLYQVFRPRRSRHLFTP